jgi:hypothetical protein
VEKGARRFWFWKKKALTYSKNLLTFPQQHSSTVLRSYSGRRSVYVGRYARGLEVAQKKVKGLASLHGPLRQSTLRELRKFWPDIIRKNNLDLGGHCHVSTAQLPPRKNSSTLIHARQIILPWFDGRHPNFSQLRHWLLSGAAPAIREGDRAVTALPD